MRIEMSINSAVRVKARYSKMARLGGSGAGEDDDAKELSAACLTDVGDDGFDFELVA